ncbi:integrase [Pseudomonas putida]|uniref:Integrase n=1 Tax=Pseudomonas putida TaxID=303 RepID=A0AAP9MYE4_PSEPU|nr:MULTISPECIES: hypothetical protein [Pseudomonas]MBP2838638.1 hypothetical protein [Pseudomonas sp. PNP]QJQ09789.1 integrase [Pseudomonas putida]
MRKFDRETHEVDIQAFELDECQRIISERPIEGLILKFTDDRSFDIGALCYQSRIVGTRSLIKKVDVSSLRPERVLAMRAWVVHKITLFYTGQSAYTVSQNASELNGFFSWADSKEFYDFLTTPENYHAALQSYTQELNAQLRSQKNHFTANRLQSEALRSGSVFFPNTKINFRDDLPLISNSSSTQSATEPPLKQEVEAYLTPCQYLFDGLTDFLLDFIKFPAQVPFMTEYIWLLPGDLPLISAELLAATSSPRLGIRWDYEKGRVRTLEEAIQFSSSQPYQVQYLLDEAHAVIKAANGDERHEKRMQLAKLAHDAFIPLFVANSGMNEQPLRDLPFDADYETFESGEKGFEGIKLRAAGREVSFSIKKTFTKHFDKFIRLRNFICKGIENEYLFVGMTVHEPEVGGKLRQSEINKLNLRIKNFLILDFQGLSYQKLRKYKSNYLLSQGHSVQVVSALMQTSQATVLKSYAKGNEATAIAEITAMIKRLVEMLDDYSGEEMPAGDCANIEGRSDAVTPPADYKPNCKDFEGCIFCSQFRTHANEPSIRKLLSMRFVILEYLSSCIDKTHFDQVHGAAVAQIDRIIAELMEERPDMTEVVDRVNAEINNEFKLSDYWKRFYHRMVKLKVMK